MKRLAIKKEIKTVDDWFKVAPPAGGAKQWREFYSAMELAIYCTRHPGRLPKEIDEYLTSIHINDKSFEAEPEAITSLSKDFCQGEGRHHDLLMVGEDVVVGIEAKAAEPLDEYVTKKAEKSESLRYPRLCEQLLGKKIEECSNIRYQLLSATIGTLIEAEKRSKTKAVLIVLVFKSHHSEEAIKHTKEDFDTFVNVLKERGNEPYHLPYNVNIDFYIKFIEVDVNSYR